MPNSNFIIAIDGPASSGKSSTAKTVAQKLGFVHLDSGAMYRAVTLLALENNIDLLDTKNLTKIANDSIIEFKVSSNGLIVLLNNKDVSHDIRTPEVTKSIAPIAANAAIREILVDKQRLMGTSQSLVADGRDIGTVVFPNADLKIFMVASIETRAKRRLLEMQQKGVDMPLEELISDMKQRDKTDTERAASPLKKADDAIELDTTTMSFDDQVDFIIQQAEKRGLK